MRLTRRRFITTSGALLGAPSFQRASQMSQASAPERQTLFRGGEGGYALYRIPGIVVTRRGSVLAYCEGRRASHSDWGTIDLLLRRSTDNGRTWDRPRRITAVDGPVQPEMVDQWQGSAGSVKKSTTTPPPAMIGLSRGGRGTFLFWQDSPRRSEEVDRRRGRIVGRLIPDRQLRRGQPLATLSA